MLNICGILLSQHSLTGKCMLAELIAYLWRRSKPLSHETCCNLTPEQASHRQQARSALQLQEELRRSGQLHAGQSDHHMLAKCESDLGQIP